MTLQCAWTLSAAAHPVMGPHASKAAWLSLILINLDVDHSWQAGGVLEKTHCAQETQQHSRQQHTEKSHCECCCTPEDCKLSKASSSRLLFACIDLGPCRTPLAPSSACVRLA